MIDPLDITWRLGSGRTWIECYLSADYGFGVWLGTVLCPHSTAAHPPALATALVFRVTLWFREFAIGVVLWRE